MTLNQLLGLSKVELKDRIQSIEPAQVKSRGLRRKFEKIRRKEGGFTLLELLVVVAILAAIGTLGALMLQDTDRKAAAGAHVAMMGELANAIQVYAVLHGGQYPNNWDSLLQNGTAVLPSATALGILSPDLFGTGTGILALSALTPEDVSGLSAKGITQVRVVDTATTPAECGTAADQKKLINSQLNSVVATNIYKMPATLADGTRAGGCGFAASAPLVDTGAVMVWPTTDAGVASRIKANVQDRIVAFGIGPNSDLFDPAQRGALAAVPVYRHVAPDEYAGFVALFNLGSDDPASTTGRTAATFHAIIDGAGDTQEEELGELDGVRAT